MVPSQRHQMTHSNNIATLKIRNIQPADSGHFTLFAENAAGCIVSTACLAVEPSSPPVKASNGVQQLQQQQRPRPVAQEPAAKMARTVSQERQPQQEVVERPQLKLLDLNLSEFRPIKKSEKVKIRFFKFFFSFS